MCVCVYVCVCMRERERQRQREREGSDSGLSSKRRPKLVKIMAPAIESSSKNTKLVDISRYLLVILLLMLRGLEME